MSCVALAAAALALGIGLGLALGPAAARAEAKKGDDAGDDERVFRTGAYVRCGLLALVLAVFGTGARLRAVAGVPPARSGSPSPARTRSIELRTRGTSPSRGHGYAC